eukprot:6177387-Pleurochrysis_carterae.AAC.1
MSTRKRAALLCSARFDRSVRRRDHRPYARPRSPTHPHACAQAGACGLPLESKASQTPLEARTSTSHDSHA